MAFTGILPMRLSKLPLYVMLSSVWKFHSQVIMVKSCDTGRYILEKIMTVTDRLPVIPLRFLTILPVQL